MNVLSLLPKDRFVESGVQIPTGLSLAFLPLAERSRLVAAAHDVQVLLMPPSQPHLDAASLKQLPQLRFVQTTGAGYDSVDHVAAARLGIAVANSPNMNASSVAEYVMASVVVLQRRLAWADAEIRAGRYTEARSALLSHGGLELRGCRFGIVGLGHIGQTVALLAQAFGCSVAAFDTFWPDDFANEHQITRMDIPELFASCDVVSLHCPLNESTKNLVDYALLHTMKPHAVLVNSARSGIVVEADLVRALNEGCLHGAALDCFAEDGRTENMFVHVPVERVLLTPHLAGVPRAAFGRMLTQALHNILCYANAHEQPRFIINGVQFP